MTDHPDNAPYLGLRPFTESEKAKFFGRDEEIHILKDKILAHRLTLLVAASGVGKSSLLQAGVMPALRASGMADLICHNDWAVDPARDLKQSIVNHFIKQQRVNADYAPDLNLPLAEFLQTHALLGIGTVVILLDQFEEFFYYQKFSQQRDQFIQQLAAALHDSDTPTAFVFSMREDFAMEMEAFKPFFKGIFDNIYRIEKLELAAARLAILNPIEAFGYHYQPALLEQLLTDLGRRERNERLDLQHADQAALTEARVEPPHLQIVCQQLWQHAHASASQEIGLDHYQQLGYAAGILSSYFNDKMAKLDRAQQRLASRAFDLLVSQHGAKMAYPLDELAKLLRENPDSLKISLDQLQTAAILRRIQRQGKPWYELYHDIFAKSITEWNQAYKKKQLREQLLKRGGAGVLTCLTLFASYDGWENHQQRHFRLGQETVSERVEVYQGKLRSWDIFGQRKFLYESDFERQDIEADKRFENEGMAERDNSVEMQIGELPLKDRFLNYAQAGLFDSADKVFEAIHITKGLASVRVINSIDRLVLFDFDALSHFHGQAVTTKLIATLNNNDANIRMSAARFLGDLEDPAVAPKLVVLLNDSDANVRQTVARALGNLRNPVAIHKLIELLSDHDNDVRCSAAIALGKIKNFAAVPALTALRNDKSEEVQICVEQSLNQFNIPIPVPKFIRFLSSPNPEVRAKAAAEFRYINKEISATKKLVALLGDNARSVAAGAGGISGIARNALIEQKYFVAIPELMDLLHSNNYDSRENAAYVLGKLKASAAIPRLLTLLSDPYDLVQSAATQALIDLQDTTATPKLIALLDSENKDARSSAADALGNLKAEAAIPKLIALLADNEFYVRSSAAVALSNLKAEAAIPELITLLADNEAYVRRRAAQVLGKLHLAGFAPDAQQKHGKLTLSDEDTEEASKPDAAQKASALIPTLDSLRADATDTLQKHYLRSAAVDGLGERGGEAAGQVLLPLLADPQLNMNVVYWLAQLAYHPAQAALQARFDTLVQQKAAWRAARDAGKFARSDKEELTAQKDNRWQDDYQLYQYAYALARIAPETDGVAMLSHPLYQVRQAAVQALAEKATGALLQQVLAAHQAFDARDLPSPFSTTAYRALDKMLAQLEFNGTKADLALLKTLKATNFPAQPKQQRALNERFDWTITELEYRLGKK